MASAKLERGELAAGAIFGMTGKGEFKCLLGAVTVAADKAPYLYNNFSFESFGMAGANPGQMLSRVMFVRDGAGVTAPRAGDILIANGWLERGGSMDTLILSLLPGGAIGFSAKLGDARQFMASYIRQQIGGANHELAWRTADMVQVVLDKLCGPADTIVSIGRVEIGSGKNNFAIMPVQMSVKLNAVTAALYAMVMRADTAEKFRGVTNFIAFIERESGKSIQDMSAGEIRDVVKGSDMVYQMAYNNFSGNVDAAAGSFGSIGGVNAIVDLSFSAAGRTNRDTMGLSIRLGELNTRAEVMAVAGALGFDKVNGNSFGSFAKIGSVSFSFGNGQENCTIAMQCEWADIPLSQQYAIEKKTGLQNHELASGGKFAITTFSTSREDRGMAEVIYTGATVAKEPLIIQCSVNKDNQIMTYSRIENNVLVALGRCDATVGGLSGKLVYREYVRGPDGVLTATGVEEERYSGFFSLAGLMQRAGTVVSFIFPVPLISAGLSYLGVGKSAPGTISLDAFGRLVESCEGIGLMGLPLVPNHVVNVIALNPQDGRQSMVSSHSSLLAGLTAVTDAIEWVFSPVMWIKGLAPGEAHRLTGGWRLAHICTTALIDIGLMLIPGVGVGMAGTKVAATTAARLAASVVRVAGSIALQALRHPVVAVRAAGGLALRTTASAILAVTKTPIVALGKFISVNFSRSIATDSVVVGFLTTRVPLSGSIFVQAFGGAWQSLRGAFTTGMRQAWAHSRGLAAEPVISSIVGVTAKQGAGGLLSRIAARVGAYAGVVTGGALQKTWQMGVQIMISMHLGGQAFQVADMFGFGKMVAKIDDSTTGGAILKGAGQLALQFGQGSAVGAIVTNAVTNPMFTIVFVVGGPLINGVQRAVGGLLGQTAGAVGRTALGFTGGGAAGAAMVGVMEFGRLVGAFLKAAANLLEKMPYVTALFEEAVKETAIQEAFLQWMPTDMQEYAAEFADLDGGPNVAVRQTTPVAGFTQAIGKANERLNSSDAPTQQAARQDLANAGIPITPPPTSGSPGTGVRFTVQQVAYNIDAIANGTASLAEHVDMLEMFAGLDLTDSGVRQALGNLGLLNMATTMAENRAGGASVLGAVTGSQSGNHSPLAAFGADISGMSGHAQGAAHNALRFAVLTGAVTDRNASTSVPKVVGLALVSVARTAQDIDAAATILRGAGIGLAEIGMMRSAIGTPLAPSVQNGARDLLNAVCNNSSINVGGSIKFAITAAAYAQVATAYQQQTGGGRQAAAPIVQAMKLIGLDTTFYTDAINAPGNAAGGILNAFAANLRANTGAPNAAAAMPAVFAGSVIEAMGVTPEAMTIVVNLGFDAVRAPNITAVLNHMQAAGPGNSRVARDFGHALALGAGSSASFDASCSNAFIAALVRTPDGRAMLADPAVATLIVKTGGDASAVVAIRDNLAVLVREAPAAVAAFTGSLAAACAAHPQAVTASTVNFLAQSAVVGVMPGGYAPVLMSLGMTADERSLVSALITAGHENVVVRAFEDTAAPSLNVALLAAAAGSANTAVVDMVFTGMKVPAASIAAVRGMLEAVHNIQAPNVRLAVLAGISRSISMGMGAEINPYVVEQGMARAVLGSLFANCGGSIEAVTPALTRLGVSAGTIAAMNRLSPAELGRYTASVGERLLSGSFSNAESAIGRAVDVNAILGRALLFTAPSVSAMRQVCGALATSVAAFGRMDNATYTAVAGVLRFYGFDALMSVSPARLNTLVAGLAAAVEGGSLDAILSAGTPSARRLLAALSPAQRSVVSAFISNAASYDARHVGMVTLHGLLPAVSAETFMDTAANRADAEARAAEYNFVAARAVASYSQADIAALRATAERLGAPSVPVGADGRVDLRQLRSLANAISGVISIKLGAIDAASNLINRLVRAGKIGMMAAVMFERAVGMQSGLLGAASTRAREVSDFTKNAWRKGSVEAESRRVQRVIDANAQYGVQMPGDAVGTIRTALTARIPAAGAMVDALIAQAGYGDLAGARRTLDMMMGALSGEQAPAPGAAQAMAALDAALGRAEASASVSRAVDRLAGCAEAVTSTSSEAGKARSLVSGTAIVVRDMLNRGDFEGARREAMALSSPASQAVIGAYADDVNLAAGAIVAAIDGMNVSQARGVLGVLAAGQNGLRLSAERMGALADSFARYANRGVVRAGEEYMFNGQKIFINADEAGKNIGEVIAGRIYNNPSFAQLLGLRTDEAKSRAADILRGSAFSGALPFEVNYIETDRGVGRFVRSIINIDLATGMLGDMGATTIIPGGTVTAMIHNHINVSNNIEEFLGDFFAMAQANAKTSFVLERGPNGQIAGVKRLTLTRDSEGNYVATMENIDPTTGDVVGPVVGVGAAGLEILAAGIRQGLPANGELAREHMVIGISAVIAGASAEAQAPLLSADQRADALAGIARGAPPATGPGSAGLGMTTPLAVTSMLAPPGTAAGQVRPALSTGEIVAGIVDGARGRQVVGGRMIDLEYSTTAVVMPRSMIKTNNDRDAVNNLKTMGVAVFEVDTNSEGEAGIADRVNSLRNGAANVRVFVLLDEKHANVRGIPEGVMVFVKHPDTRWNEVLTAYVDYLGTAKRTDVGITGAGVNRLGREKGSGLEGAKGGTVSDTDEKFLSDLESELSY
jgi:hypothetical protein